MKNKGIKIILSMCVIWIIIYNLKSFVSLDISYSMPCVGLGEYSVGDFVDKHKDDESDYYRGKVGNMTFDTTNMRSGNVNSMEGLSDLPYTGDIESMLLDGSCITQVEDIEGLTNLKRLSLNNTKLKTMEGLEGLNTLENLYLDDTNIKTVSNIENIRTNTNTKLYVTVGGKKVKSITEESYDYVMDPSNNITVDIYDYDRKLDLTINPVYGDTREEIEERIDIV